MKLPGKLFSVLLLFLIVTNFSSGIFFNHVGKEMFYNADVKLNISNNYRPGEEISFNITVSNYEKFPLPPSYAVIYLNKGCEDVYVKNQNSPCNTIIEKKVDNITIGSASKERVSAKMKLPEDISNGTYRLDVYLQPKRGYIQGFVESFYMPAYDSFKVEGDGKFPKAEINRSKTIIAGSRAQGGPAASPGEFIAGSVSINSETIFDRGVLEMYVCEWDDTSCSKNKVSKAYPLNLSEGTKPVQINFTNPEKPGAYSIKLLLKENSGRTHSIYKSRIVSEGEDARIQKFFVNTPYKEEEKPLEIHALVTGPPFPSSYKEVEDVRTVFSLKKDNETLNKTTSEKKVLRQEEYTLFSTEIGAEGRLDYFTACAKVIKDSKTLDKVCDFYDSSNYLNPSREFSMDHNYDEKKLDLRICLTDNRGIRASSNVEYTLMKDLEEIKTSEIKLDGCEEFSVDVNSTEHRLVLEDLDKDYRQSFEISKKSNERNDSKIEEKDINEKSDSEVTGKIFLPILVVVLIGLAVFLKNGGGKDE